MFISKEVTEIGNQVLLDKKIHNINKHLEGGRLLVEGFEKLILILYPPNMSAKTVVNEYLACKETKKFPGIGDFFCGIQSSIIEKGMHTPHFVPRFGFFISNPKWIEGATVEFEKGYLTVDDEVVKESNISKELKSALSLKAGEEITYSVDAKDEVKCFKVPFKGAFILDFHPEKSALCSYALSQGAEKVYGLVAERQHLYDLRHQARVSDEKIYYVPGSVFDVDSYRFYLEANKKQSIFLFLLNTQSQVLKTFVSSMNVLPFKAVYITCYEPINTDIIDQAKTLPNGKVEKFSTERKTNIWRISRG